MNNTTNKSLIFGKKSLDLFSTLGFELVMQLCKQIILNT